MRVWRATYVMAKAPYQHQEYILADDKVMARDKAYSLSLGLVGISEVPTETPPVIPEEPRNTYASEYNRDYCHCPWYQCCCQHSRY